MTTKDRHCCKTVIFYKIVLLYVYVSIHLVSMHAHCCVPYLLPLPVVVSSILRALNPQWLRLSIDAILHGWVSPFLLFYVLIFAYPAFLNLL